MKRSGRLTKEWIQRRKRWVHEHPPNHQGAWVCYLCQQWVFEKDMELDHVQPKGSTSASVAGSDDNLRPTHRLCNRDKGSKKYHPPTSRSSQAGKKIDLEKW